MKAYEDLQLHRSSKTSSLWGNAVQIVLVGMGAYLISVLIFLAVMFILPNPCGSDDAIDMYGCHPDGSV